MEDLKNAKVNIESAADLPRKEDGSLDLEKISTGKTDKGFYIVPDEVMDTHYRELPAGTINESGTWRASCNGKLKILGGNPEDDKRIHIAGGKALQATLEQRRSIKEILEQLSRKAANPEDLERLGLEEGTTTLEAANYAAIQRAIRGDIKALEYVRDTLGEKPADKISAEVTALTPEDKEMLARVQARLDSM